MLQIIFTFVGLYILIKGRINFSREKELVRPNSIFIGIIFILLALFLFVFFTPTLDLIIGVVSFIVIFSISYFLSQNASGDNIIKKYSGIKTLWLLLSILSLFIAPFTVFLFDNPSSNGSVMTNILAISLLTAPISFLIGAVTGYVNEKKDKNYLLVYLPFVNIFCFLVVSLILAFYCGGRFNC